MMLDIIVVILALAAVGLMIRTKMKTAKSGCCSGNCKNCNGDCEKK